MHKFSDGNKKDLLKLGVTVIVRSLQISNITGNDFALIPTARIAPIDLILY